MPIHVRQATLSDYRALCALFEELDAFHSRARPDFFRPFDGPARTWEQVGKWLADPDSTVLVAEEGAKDEADVIGLAVLLPRPPSPFAGAVPRKVVVLDNLVVRADRRDRKTGEKLVAAAMEWARGQGASHVELGVHAVNRHALRFYERLGFSVSVHWLSRAA
ncbi:GNAT family N-acetyltransferase [Reyranella sp.]|uniref:GNAT family N-acetyltransferase n=1 Tax=Reyranella sp. TaxID=1929291 RepID=UPI002730DD55|nr:GNAT family N-acetyltransferase [Reyranella sp.]MDP2375620.1 GNAT family N-acetyltransferase [Reyranella sp.]